MATGRVIEWDGANGLIGETTTADRVRFTVQSLHILLPGDVRVGLDVEFDRVDVTGNPHGNRPRTATDNRHQSS